MDTTRVDICYRPLRIAWAILSGDYGSFRQAVRLSYTLWGGRFNPIVFADRPEEAKEIVERFRADMIWPVGQGDAVTQFPARFPYLVKPFFADTLFRPGMNDRARAQVLDVHNMLAHFRHTPEWRALDERGVRSVMWAPDDPLADTFLVQHGAYPDAAVIGINYAEILSQATLAINLDIDPHGPIRTDFLDHVSVAFLARHGTRRHYSVRPEWDYPGFFVGDATNLEDLVRFWNIRAADIPLYFVDPAHVARYERLIPEVSQRMRADLAHLREHRRNVAIWARADRLEEALRLFPDQRLSGCPLDDERWVSTIRAPMMILGEASSLGVFGTEADKPRVSFSLSDKPFSSDRWFYTQHLVASVSLSGGDEQQTFHAPYVPELNEFFSRTMHFQHDKLRVEPERIGIVIDAADHDSFLYPLPVGSLVGQLFGMVGLDAKLSAGGLLTRQLIARLGGVDGARVFKIPGVRRLLKTFGPTDAFTRNTALSMIGGPDPDNLSARFQDHERLFIEARDIGSVLTPSMVFTYLVDKGLLRMGAKLTCPTCALPSWIALDALKQTNVCELCGATYDATRQLVKEVFHYRRTGVLGLERNSQGAIPVTLVLQQLGINLGDVRGQSVYAPSYELTPRPGVNLPTCEVDFVKILSGTYPDPVAVILGEVKDEGSRIDAQDVDNLRRIADALPAHRFEAFILFAKLRI
jgi:hypothetical protein